MESSEPKVSLPPDAWYEKTGASKPDQIEYIDDLMNNIAGVEGHISTTMMYSDVEDFDRIAAGKDCDNALLHLMALKSIASSWSEDKEDALVNIENSIKTIQSHKDRLLK